MTPQAEHQHGTYARWSQHKRDGEKPCPSCTFAQAEYIRQWRRRKGQGSRQAAPVPITLPDKDLGIATLIARGYREGA